jgi:hypothetical protein
MTFDAIAYLTEHDPDVQYQTQKLSGGLINFTVRATKPAKQSRSGRYPCHPSLILKHAPPYLAALGPAVPLDTRRQTVEASALQVLSLARQSSEASPQLSSLITTGEVAVPEFLHHDDVANVLIMSDLGDKPDLSALFAELGGTIPSEQSCQLPISKLPFADESQPSFEDLGGRLGTFFGGLHSSAVRDEVRHLLSQHQISLENPAAKVFVSAHAIEPILGLMNRISGLLQPDEARVLYIRVYEDFWRRNEQSEICFTLGDCWTVSDPNVTLHSAAREQLI